MSKNNFKQHDRDHNAPQPGPQEQTLLRLFSQLSEPDKQHVMRLLQALSDTAR